MSRYIALVPAAGSGSRFGAPSPKQYLQLNSKPLMWHTLKTLASVAAIDEVAVVISAQDEWFDDFSWDIPKLTIHRVGGETRAHTVSNGLLVLALAENDWVLVHDAARCCISVDAVERLIASIADDDVGGLLALPVPDTIKRADAEGRVGATVPRQNLWLAQTPQMFKAGLLRQSLATRQLSDITDEASAIEMLGLKPVLIEGEAQNFKVTYPRDLALARAILASRKDS